MTNVMTRTTPRAAAPEAPGGLSRGLLLLMSVSTGLVAAGNYFAQPLLDVIRQDLQLSTSTAAMVVTAAQAGYALGLILLLPSEISWSVDASRWCCSGPPRYSCWCRPPPPTARSCWRAPHSPPSPRWPRRCW
ncbi:hypothetical protein [Rhodococcus sp. MTM3W5.2]|uniref:hypothetical protein n=1 Tax=Rhodococcus sp. MTM3W5.2 TaxID=1805827 RepID=UPI001CB8FE13|nr:hypothetical protein [Rhodococcus sp. MTM3W5.2]